MTPPPPPEAVHLPFSAGPYRMAMGLLSCPIAEWIEIDDQYAAEMAERRALLATRHAQVFAACPGSEAARAEFLEVLADHLAAHFPAWFRREGGVLRNALTGEAWDLDDPPCDPLELAGRLVQEDVCLIRPAAAEGPLLEAGLLCFPTRWRLTEKIGRPLLAVHGPVPLYRERLGDPVDRFMAQIKPGRVALRMNWSILDDPALFQPWGRERTAQDPSITAANAGERLFLRMERQTFRRLPRSGSVAFGIRVHRYGLSRITALPGGVAARLAEAVRALPEEITAYKALRVFRDALLDHLDAAAAG